MAANRQTTRPEYSPEAQERRAKRAAKAERTKAVVADALDLGKGWSGPQVGDRVLDGGAELAVRQSRAAIEAGRPLRPREKRALRQQ
jgi:hypothetical protein